MRIITNNPLVHSKYGFVANVEYIDCTYIDIFYKVRDYLHIGYPLLSHPLAGSMKPNQTPYRSVVIGDKKEKVDFYGLSIMDECLESAKKFLNIRKLPDWPEEILRDFQTVDCTFLEYVFGRSSEVM